MTATRPLTESTSLPAALAARGLGALWKAISFATAVPLDGVKVMPAQAVSGALAFTAGASPQAGATCYVRLTADGTHVPTFPGMVEHGSSAGWNNTAGVTNLVTFWHDGTATFYAIAQAVGAAAAATITSAVIANATPTQITVTFSVPLDPADVPAASAFALTNTGGADAVTGVAITNGNLVLTKSRATLFTDVVTLAYTKPGSAPLTDTNGNAISSVTSRTVTNQVNGNNWLRFTTSAHLTESGDGAGGYDYTADETVTSIYAGAWAYSTKVLGAGADGSFQVKNNGAAPYVGFATAAAPTDFSQTTYGFYANGGQYNTNAMSPINTISVGSGDLLRMRRTGTTVYGEVSKDGGTTWLTVGSAAGASTAALTPYMQAGAVGVLVEPIGTANIA